ncbi:MAG: hypothetical protein IJJ69_03115 [Oscillospiraceae bacterium]|nr:hypothetical protein [Oscillospiraceae bacterium]
MKNISVKRDYGTSILLEDAEPWERYSASVGMAEVANDDNTVELVFKRADRAMYEDKMKFKKEHGSYR